MDQSLTENEKQVRAHYRALRNAWGPQHWWPARTRFEVIVGAYLTQNTSWTNVEMALRRLRSAKILTLSGIRNVALADLEILIRSSGYFRQKALRLKIFVSFVDRRYGGSLSRLFSHPTEKLRGELLALNGVGPETADSILLYAGQHPVFVVDTYTRRILERHGIISEDTRYEDVRELFERALGSEQINNSKSSETQSDTWTGHAPSAMSITKRSKVSQIYNDMHGLIVNVGKRHCLKSTPLCERCPLQPFLPSTGPRLRSKS